MSIPLYKRKSNTSPNYFWHRLLISVGVFLMGTLVFAPQKTNAISFSPLEEKLQILEKQEKKLDKVEKVVKEVEQKAAEIDAQIEKSKSELEELKAKLEEKKRLDALRIVPASAPVAGSSGNTYAPGNCTWYAKTKRPDLPNRMGNAMYWYGAAQSAGYRTGSQAKANAIGVSFEGWAGHVVYVEKWLGDGQILISEMNAQGFGVISSRVADESEFVYIYDHI